MSHRNRDADQKKQGDSNIRGWNNGQIHSFGYKRKSMISRLFLFYLIFLFEAKASSKPLRISDNNNLKIQNNHAISQTTPLIVRPLSRPTPVYEPSRHNVREIGRPECAATAATANNAFNPKLLISPVSPFQQKDVLIIRHRGRFLPGPMLDPLFQDSAQLPATLRAPALKMGLDGLPLHVRRR